MPKKASSWGQQDYVPAGNGDASGEYADDSGSNIHYTFDPENFGRGKGQVKEEPKKEEGHISVSKGDGGQPHFQDYLKNEFKPMGGVTAEGLERQFNTGTDDAKSIINMLIKNGFKVEGIRGRDRFIGKTIELSSSSTKENQLTSNEGEVFFHEFFHGVDHFLAEDVSKEELEEAKKQFASNNWKNADSFLSQNYATATKKLSNGKTLYQTLVEEAKKKGREGFRQILQDYRSEGEAYVKEKLGMTSDEFMKRLSDARKRFREQAVKEGFTEWTGAFYERTRQLENSDEEFKELLGKEKILRDSNFNSAKYWSSISDVCEGSGYGSFCGGHGSSYWKSGTARGTKLHRGGEFIAEYCSAYSRRDTNGKKELELFEKYFPETSKCARELFEMALKKAKGEK